MCVNIIMINEKYKINYNDQIYRNVTNVNQIKNKNKRIIASIVTITQGTKYIEEKKKQT